LLQYPVYKYWSLNVTTVSCFGPEAGLKVEIKYLLSMHQEQKHWTTNF